MGSNKDKLFVFGDSHSIIWEGSELPERGNPPFFSDVVVHHLGPALAWTINEKWKPQIIEVLDNLTTTPETIFLSFGEIDIRTGRDKLDTAAARLVLLACDLASIFGSKVVALSPPPTATCESILNGSVFPCRGSVAERNAKTRAFCKNTKLLIDAARKEYRVDFIDIHNILLPVEDTAREDIFCDGRHLNRKALAEILKSLHETTYAKYFINTRGY